MGKMERKIQHFKIRCFGAKVSLVDHCEIRVGGVREKYAVLIQHVVHVQHAVHIQYAVHIQDAVYLEADTEGGPRGQGGGYTDRWTDS